MRLHRAWKPKCQENKWTQFARRLRWCVKCMFWETDENNDNSQALANWLSTSTICSTQRNQDKFLQTTVWSIHFSYQRQQNFSIKTFSANENEMKLTKSCYRMQSKLIEMGSNMRGASSFSGWNVSANAWMRKWKKGKGGCGRYSLEKNWPAESWLQKWCAGLLKAQAYMERHSRLVDLSLAHIAMSNVDESQSTRTTPWQGSQLYERKGEREKCEKWVRASFKWAVWHFSNWRMWQAEERSLRIFAITHEKTAWSRYEWKLR